MSESEKRLLNEKWKSDKAIDMCSEILFKMDPFARELWVERYKDAFVYLKKKVDRIYPGQPPSNEEKMYKEILEVLFQKYEENLKDEEFKGENYLDIPFKSKHENIYEKRIEQIREDFPPILSEEDEDAEEDEEWIEELEGELQSIANKEDEDKESLEDSKPNSDRAFSDSIKDFLKENGAVIISANFWTLAEIASQVDPETWEEDFDHIESVINNYNLLSNKDDLLEWINEKIDLYEEMGYLDKFLKIGNSEECDYPDAESFLESIDCEYIIGVLDICWANACTNNKK
ncbi:hypothetical protein PMT9312_1141 [Prochlorococcus marinus str. MIT 9312]|uniref:Uncharacterized protein n=1 Tax=Prochlorococcus marinus (strain MIT 9312) TaxID=74546 RepID=Q31A95_PROM9|nr:hypothetical protein [Prochlorococcus marinus]ABB50200.1 hypothetical protein PMT9312_1141 [Prochlorococcus marinus str. MIT 9312]KGG00003.1 hypothetical protein EU97_0933 [Prochlorococcus marinus str. MIT 9311]